ncbi:hypothetical protein CK507_09940 [Pseudomonas sp. WN033]|nr:hypothetical protein CK507_09940 [Pseudomonas sp. WN033]
MKPVLGALTLVTLGSLSGCGYFFGEDGYFRDRGGDYQAAVIEPRMTVPAGVESKPIGDLLPVPGRVEPGPGGKFQTPRPQALMVTADTSDFSLQQNGPNRWLLAQRTPVEAWPLVRQFFSDYQVPLSSENPRMGELETSGLVFDQQADNPLVRRLVPAVGPNRRTDGQEQRFRLRIEPGVQSGTSEIQVVHTSRSQGSTLSSWPERSDNPNLERALLAELESYLSQSADSDSASLVAAQGMGQSDRVTLEQDGAGNPVLNMQTDFNRAWAAVGEALNRADVLVSDINRSAGVYYVDLEQRASQQQRKRGFFARMFGRDKPQESASEERIQVRLTPVANRVQVTVEKSIDTAADAVEARQLLERIRNNLT